MADETRVIVHFFPNLFGRWHFCCIWPDGVNMRSTKAVWRYRRAVEVAYRTAQEARSD